MSLRTGDFVRIKKSEDGSVGNLYCNQLGVIVAIIKDADPDGSFDIKFGPSIDMWLSGKDGIKFRKKGRITRFSEKDLIKEKNAQKKLKIKDYVDLFDSLSLKYTRPPKRCICQKRGCSKNAESMIWINQFGIDQLVAACDMHAREFNGAWTECFLG